MPLEASGKMFLQAKTHSLQESESSSTRPVSPATQILDTDFEDDSEFEEYSSKGSFETDERRTSQTTLSSYDEAQTPSSSRSRRRSFELRLRPVEGPKGPHLFRASQSSAEFQLDYALQMSPLLPKQPPSRTESAISDNTVTTVIRQNQFDQDFPIASALYQALDHSGTDSKDARIRSWTPQQVVDWLLSAHIDSSVIDCFEHHDVDGVVLTALQFDDLKELDIQSFGKRHQVWNAICELRGEQWASPQPTPFEDTSRPCTTNPRRSPSRNRSACQTPVDSDHDAAHGKKRRGRKGPKGLDVITPQESVSIVAIEQLIPKPHKCAKGERCAKFRKQQRELNQLHEDGGIGRFPISPGKGGRVFVRGDPGNADTADNMIPNVRLQLPHDPFRPQSDAIPSVVASSDLLGPGQLPEFALHPDMLEQLDKRDPQDNVRQFLNFQHLQSPAPPLDDAPPTPPPELFPARHFDPLKRSETTPPALFPAQHHQAYPSLDPSQQTAGPQLHQLRQLPKLDIPKRSATAAPVLNACSTTVPASAASSICRSVTASPVNIFRVGTPASEMDVPVTAFPFGPVARDASASVPPNMQYRPGHNLPTRSASRAEYYRRPSQVLPAVKENEVFSPVSEPQNSRPSVSSRSNSGDGKSSIASSRSTPEKKVSFAAKDPAQHSPITQHFGYGSDVQQAGWMKKRKTKMLRHEWQDAHFRLKGTDLAMYRNARLSSAAMDHINVDDYAVACSTVASNSKLTAAMKAFKIRDDAAAKKAKDADPTAFAFQLVPALKQGESPKKAANGKTHHFAVKTKDDRIDWMRELMLAKALQQKGKGYEVVINGAQV